MGRNESESASWKWISWTILGVGIVAGTALRLWIAFHDQGTYWADEIYQSLEPGHHLAFGYGLLPWEYLQGARTWVFSGLIAGLMKLASWVGLNAPWQYLGVIRLALVANAGATIIGSYLLARRLATKPIPAALGALLLALWPTAIYFSFRAFSEVATSGLVVFGLWLAFDDKEQRSWTSGLGVALLTLAAAMRLQNVIFLVGGVLMPVLALVRTPPGLHLRGVNPEVSQLVRAGRQRATVAIASFFFGLFLIGLIDRLTWGAWFHSVRTYLTFNATGASGWGVAPFGYYWTTIQQSLGGLWVPLAALLLLSLRRGWPIAAIVAVFLLTHANVPHKELRFLYPAFGLLAALIGIGLSELWDWISRINTRRVWSSASWRITLRMLIVGTMLGLILWIGRSPFQIARATVDIKVIDGAADQATAYGQYDSENRLLWAAYQQADLCGLSLDLAPVSTGGYSYLHRNVPLYQNEYQPDAAGFYNYKITTTDEGATIQQIGQRRLARLSNKVCQPDPNYRLPSL